MAIKPSRFFIMLLLLLHTITAVVVYVTDVQPMARLAMFLLISLSLFYHLARNALLLPGSWSDVSLDRGGVAVVTQDGSRLVGVATGRSIVSPYFVVLCVKLKGRLAVSRIVFPDALEAGEFRELCVRLRFA